MQVGAAAGNSARAEAMVMDVAAQMALAAAMAWAVVATAMGEAYMVPTALAGTMVAAARVAAARARVVALQRARAVAAMGRGVEV